MATNTFEVEIKNLDKLVKTLEESPKRATPILQEAIVKAAGILAENTDSQTVPFKTGNLIRSFQPAAIGQLFARWYPRALYAPYLEFGTSRGIKPRKFMEKILSKATPKVNQLFRNALKAIIERIAS